MADLAFLTADQLAARVRLSTDSRLHDHPGVAGKDGCLRCGSDRALAELVRRLKTAEDALDEIGSAKVLAYGDFGHELRARQDIARAALAATRPNPKP